MSTSTNAAAIQKPPEDHEYIWTSSPFISSDTTTTTTNSSTNTSTNTSTSTTPTTKPRKIPILNQQLHDFEKSSLHCPICQEFFTNAVTLKACNHSFCSECLRKSLATQWKSIKRSRNCPCCRAKVDDDAKAIAPNWALQGIVDKYKDLRHNLYKSMIELNNYRSGQLENNGNTTTTSTNGCQNKKSSTTTTTTATSGQHDSNEESDNIKRQSKRSRRDTTKHQNYYESDENDNDDDDFIPKKNRITTIR